MNELPGILEERWALVRQMQGKRWHDRFTVRAGIVVLLYILLRLTVLK